MNHNDAGTCTINFCSPVHHVAFEMPEAADARMIRLAMLDQGMRVTLTPEDEAAMFAEADKRMLVKP
ncbi:MAG: hypothetical protein ABI268_05425 [Rhodanobacter sp.]